MSFNDKVTRATFRGTIHANQTYANQMRDLKVYLDNLSVNEIMNSFLLIGGTTVAFFELLKNGKQARYIMVHINGSGSLNMRSYMVDELKVIAYDCNPAASWDYIDLSTNIATNTIDVYA